MEGKRWLGEKLIKKKILSKGEKVRNKKKMEK